MNNMDTFKKDFEEIFDEIPEGITSETVFRSLPEWDSMAALSLIAMLDEKYSLTLSVDELKQANTVQELYSLVSSKG